MLGRPARDQLDAATTRYAAALTPAHVAYLAGRGLDVDLDLPGELGNPWRFGTVLDPAPGHEDMTGRLAIPYLVPHGGPVGMKFRCPQDHKCADLGHAKYLSHPGMGQRLYAVWNLRTDADTVAITEGEFDALIAETAGLPAVAVPGVNGWAKRWVHLFEGYDRVLVIGDGDDAGRKFAERVAGDLDTGRAVVMPPGEDVTSFVLEHGTEAFRSRIGL